MFKYLCVTVAFLFNWIGFLLLMCFCHTIASRYGALAGFGLSLTKWTLIVKHSTDLASRENSWLWWLIMAFGLYDAYEMSIFQVFRLLSSIKKHDDVVFQEFSFVYVPSSNTWTSSAAGGYYPAPRKSVCSFSIKKKKKNIESAPSLSNLALEQAAFLCGVVFVWYIIDILKREKEALYRS